MKFTILISCPISGVGTTGSREPAALSLAFAFEDYRTSTPTAVWNSLRYDADHLVGIELAELKLGAWRRLYIELEHTGWVSQEHWVFTTGMTNAGRTLGSALGPDGTSLWLRADFEAGRLVLSPWVEWLRFSGNQYGLDVPRGPFVTVMGPIEHRQRLGADAQVALTQSLAFSGGVFGERIGNAALVNGSTNYSGGLRASLIWTP